MEQAMSDNKSMICHHKQDWECQKGVKMKQGVATSLLLFCLEGLMVAKEIRNKKTGVQSFQTKLLNKAL